MTRRNAQEQISKGLFSQAFFSHNDTRHRAAGGGARDERGGRSGTPGVAKAQRAAEKTAAGEHPLIGQPTIPKNRFSVAHSKHQDSGV